MDPAFAWTPEQLRVEGFRVLCRGLGAAAALRFVLEYERGRGDYSRERRELLAGVNEAGVQRLVQQAMADQAKPARPRRGAGKAAPNKEHARKSR